ncbi:hypothetical protein, partial [Escherichia coli]|uniref:hypothetical protein n=1 Tax=Escherichia coli TaxID=562 RepID=UPI0032DA1E27
RRGGGAPILGEENLDLHSFEDLLGKLFYQDLFSLWISLAFPFSLKLFAFYIDLVDMLFYFNALMLLKPMRG